MERYCDRVRKAQAPPQKVSLREVVGRLEPRYFPRELWATCVHEEEEEGDSVADLFCVCLLW